METGRHARSSTLAVLCAVLFVTFLDNTIVSVTLADIQGKLHAGVQTLQWVVNGYALSFASLMLVGGMLGDLFGRRKVMLAGLALFSAGSVVAAVAPTASWLLVGRVGHGGRRRRPRSRARCRSSATSTTTGPIGRGRWVSGPLCPAPPSPSAR